jgi:Helix-turn-helix domain
MKSNAISIKPLTHNSESGGAEVFALNSTFHSEQNGAMFGQMFNTLFGQFIDTVRAVVKQELNQHHSAQTPADIADSEKLLTPQQTAELLGICRQTVFDWAKRGLLLPHRLGGRTYFKRGELLSALKSPEQSTGRRKYARRTR